MAAVTSAAADSLNSPMMSSVLAGLRFVRTRPLALGFHEPSM
jgi:hypothetical protein